MHSNTEGHTALTVGLSISMKDFPELNLGALLNALLFLGKARTRPIDVKRQHRHGGTIRFGSAAVTGLGRALERERNAARIGLFENVGFEVQRVAVAGNFTGPITRFGSLFH